ncbi:hypothetical protein AMTR_s00157p00056590 [Amborella trichopoda]|uniref:Uncharacterized protein n=1 Tax=Amborella trichopoda TaxID=13333 RepID=W1PHW3_AMBTC|nr:hypothetical protein AMTR_s00157p00056590 [Amborella trichopoda]
MSRKATGVSYHKRFLRMGERRNRRRFCRGRRTVNYGYYRGNGGGHGNGASDRGHGNGDGGGGNGRRGNDKNVLVVDVADGQNLGTHNGVDQNV